MAVGVNSWSRRLKCVIASRPHDHSLVASERRRATAPNASTSSPESISSSTAKVGRRRANCTISGRLRPPPGRTEEGELHHLGALTLAAGEIDVHETIQDFRTQFNAFGLVAHSRSKVRRI